MMSKNKKNFIRDLENLVQKEEENNIKIKGNIQKIFGKEIVINLDTSMNVTSNTLINVDNYEAILLKVEYKKITCSLNEDAHKLYVGKDVEVYDLQKSIIVSKLSELVNILKNDNLSKANMETLAILIDSVKIDAVDSIYDSENLNHNQNLAVGRALANDKFHLIQGPPGTGKTHIIIEIIKELFKRQNRILITTHTHVALDNILERLDDINPDEILRVGDVSRINESSLKYSLDSHIKNHSKYEELAKLKKRLESLESRLIEDNLDVDYTKMYPDTNDGKFSFTNLFLSNDEDSVSKNYYSDAELQDVINDIKIAIDQLENYIIEDIMSKVKIIATTVLASSNVLIKNIDFDYTVMDESSQVALYLALIPLMKTDKFILIGDNKQLQPITNNNAVSLLNTSIFNLLMQKYPDNYTFLNMQYRMNETICNLSSTLYYGGKLKTHHSIKDNKLELMQETDLINNDEITVIDTSKMQYHQEKGGGCFNKKESKVVIGLVKMLLSNGIAEEDIGVITPYRKQKNYIQKKLFMEGINVESDTVYRFQGREKKIIIITFCKSSYNKLDKFQKRFLSNPNQLNVSLTRAKEKLIIVGNLSTLTQSENIKNIINLIDDENIIDLSEIQHL